MKALLFEGEGNACSCAKRFTTYEKIETLPIFVIKKDGRSESFDGNKIMAGLLKACEKRPIAIKELDKLVQDIEKVHIQFIGTGNNQPKDRADGYGKA